MNHLSNSQALLVKDLPCKLCTSVKHKNNCNKKKRHGYRTELNSELTRKSRLEVDG